MELKQSCKVLLDNNKLQKVSCMLFDEEQMQRQLALHEDIDCKGKSSLTDVKTGLRLLGISKEATKVKPEDIEEAIDTFIKHFTIEEIQNKFSELDKVAE